MRGVEPTGTNGRSRHIFPIPVGLGLVLWWFLVGWQGMLFLVVTATILVRRFACVRCPVPGPPRSESWLVPLPAEPQWGLAVQNGFAVVMAQVRRPVPFRTRKLRPGRGDGTALERVWESSTPPHSLVGGSRRASRSGNPRFFFIRSRPLFIRLPVLAPRGMQEFFISRHLCIAWSVSVTVSNDVMRLTRYARAGSRESRYDGERQEPDD